MRGITASAWLVTMCVAAGIGLLAAVPGQGRRAVAVRVDRIAGAPIEAGTRVEVLLRGRYSNEPRETSVRLESVYVSGVEDEGGDAEQIELDLTPEQEVFIRQARSIQLAVPDLSPAEKTETAAAPAVTADSPDPLPARSSEARRAVTSPAPRQSPATGREAPMRVVNAELKPAGRQKLFESFIASRNPSMRVIGALLRYLLLPGALILMLYGGVFGFESARTRHRGYRRKKSAVTRASAG